MVAQHRWLLAQQLSSTPSQQWWRVIDELEPTRQGIAKFFVGNSQRLRTYFEREAIIAATVRSANLIPLLAADLDGCQPVLIWPWLNHRRLDQWLARPAKLPPKPILLWVARQLLQGLAGLHNAGYVHGNVRPENVLLSDDFRVHLIGLGRCEAVGETLPVVQRPTRYDPPETRQNRFESSSARDIYSSATVMVDLLGNEFASSDLGRQMLASLVEERPTAGQLATELLNLEHQMLGKFLRAA